MVRSNKLIHPIVDKIFAPSENKLILPNKDGLLMPEDSPNFFSKLELDLEKVVGSVLSASNKKVRPDIKIDDRDIAEYPNFFKFCTDPEGLGFLPYSRQMMMGIQLFSEYCPNCSEEEYIHPSLMGVPVDLPTRRLEDHVVFLEFGVCPQCHKNKLDFLRAGLINYNQGLVAICGQRSGKSATSGALSAYLLHKLLKLQNPPLHYDLSASSTLTGTFVALNFESTMRLLWNPFKVLIAGSTWFSSYHALLNHYVEKYDDEDLYRNMGTSLRYRHRNLFWYPASPSAQTLRGDTRILAVIDELGHMDNTESTKVRNADEVYNSLDRSLFTARINARKAMREGYVDTPNAFNIAISSPASAYDKMMMMKQQYSLSKKMYVVHLATWEMNPTVKKRDLKEEYYTDPIKADRDYGANPPLSAAPFIEDFEAAKACFSGKGNIIKYKYESTKRKSGGLFKSAIITDTLNRNSVPASFLALDAGETNNSFALSLGHLEYATDKINVMPFGSYPEEHEMIPVVDSLIEVIADKGKSVINFTAIAEQLIYPIIEKNNVQLVVADRWQGIKFLHDIEDKFKIKTQVYSLKYDDMLLFKSYIDTSTIVFPKLERKLNMADLFTLDLSKYPECFTYEPSTHLLLQMMTVVEGPKNVDKGKNLTDDLFRSTSLLTSFLLDEDYRDLLRSAIKKERQSGIIGVAQGLSGGKILPTQRAYTNTGATNTGKTIGVFKPYR